MISPTATGPHPHPGQRSKERGPPRGEGRTLGWVDRVLGAGPDSSSPSPPTHHVLRAPPMSSPLVLTWTLCRRVLVIFTAQAAEAQGREGPGGTWLRRIKQSHRVPEPGGPWSQFDRHVDLRCGTREAGFSAPDCSPKLFPQGHQQPTLHPKADLASPLPIP